jgi:alkyl sulfatase BDS1-like metallo-beta-lactamase superfamily hydrolase
MIRTAALAAAIALGTVSAYAQTAAPAKAEAAAKPAKAGKAAKGKKAAPAEKTLPAADQAQLDAAERTYFGNYECDFKQSIDVGMNPKTPGYVDVKFKAKTFTMKPVLSSTGALRLEDITGRTLLIQIANKSMLMDVKAGQRLVDDCVHEKQRAASVAAKG